ncbi:udp-glucosyl transferase family protein [Lasallia pustulata]|uniref:Udp-glucosyl transferase family protein n=1 Tax=Lasallia pustulata TaxID=136370 RepID=A0A1W5CY37_9LECA|nr:udp-glucosyl transferase family protein [Lasallia pustulata]
MQAKPDYLLFVNAMFGIEVPKDLPPLVNAVGPILSDSYPPLTPELEQSLHTHDRVLYVAFGTHVILPFVTLAKIIEGVSAAISLGHLDSVIWALRSTARKQITGSSFARTAPNISNAGKGTVATYEDLLNNKHPQYHFVDFAPQRAILAHPSTHLFLTHAGPSSANESLFHGVPMIAMGIYGDQLPNSMRLSAAGVAESMSKDDSALASTLTAKIVQVIEDSEGRYARDVLRLQRIAASASRRKILAADLIEEVMYDHELRFEDSGMGRGRARRPMHLQTADMRMSWWRANNVDLWLAVGGACGLLIGVGWGIVGRWGW